MAHSALRIANAVCQKAVQLNMSPTPMQLLKLTYLAQGWMLGLYRQPLIVDDVEAWRYGPVFRDVYRHVAGKSSVAGGLPARDSGDLDHLENDLLDQILQIYGKMSGLQLSTLTHTSGSPWDVTYRQFGQNAVIPKALMQEYYGHAARGAR